jgi:ribonuclease Z
MTFLLHAGLRIGVRPPTAPKRDAGDDNFHVAAMSPCPPTLPALTLQRFVETKALVNAQRKIADPSPGTEISVIPLGTGSAVPSKYRNVSGTLVQIPRWGNILLDAGEGTWGQLVRHFGDDGPSHSGIWEVLRNLKCIFISHIHGDHHIGLAKILAMRQNMDPPVPDPLYLVGSRNIHIYLRELSDLEDLGLNPLQSNGVVTVISDALHWKGRNAYHSHGVWAVTGSESWLDLCRSQRLARDLCNALGLRSFETVDVRHKTRCYGVVMKHTDGWSLVFSGDTMPSESLIAAGENATLLIHEASMADDQADLAKRNGHSTFGQAVDVARRMKAKHVLLTHFSARYPKMPPSDTIAPGSESVNPIIALAFDQAKMSIGTMWKMKHYMPAIQQCIQDTTDDGDTENPGLISIDDPHQLIDS